MLYIYKEEILERVPPTVYQVNVLNGSNSVILLTLDCGHLADYLVVGHVMLQVKKFRQKPTQCFNCFEYGHVKKYCPNEKCFPCSTEHEVFDVCFLSKVLFPLQRQ